MNATRSRRLSALKRSVLSVGWDGCWSTPTFSSVARETAALAHFSAEPNGDPPSAEVGDELLRAHFLELASEVNHVGRQGRDVDGSLGAPIARGELSHHHPRQGRGITQRCPDRLVARIGRRSVLHRTDVLIADNTGRAQFA
jgi:hypothetical protein